MCFSAPFVHNPLISNENYMLLLTHASGRTGFLPPSVINTQISLKETAHQRSSEKSGKHQEKWKTIRTNVSF